MSARIVGPGEGNPVRGMVSVPGSELSLWKNQEFRQKVLLSAAVAIITIGIIYMAVYNSCYHPQDVNIKAYTWSIVTGWSLIIMTTVFGAGSIYSIDAPPSGTIRDRHGNIVIRPADVSLL